MRVLHLLQSGFYSGAENVVCQIIDAMENESDVQMIYCSPDGSIRDVLEGKKIDFLPIKRLSLLEVKKAFNKFEPDIIHAHDMRASFIAALVCGEIPLISHIHNNSFESRKLSIKTILFRYAAKKANHIFWVSDSSYNGYYFSDTYKQKGSVLYNIMNVENIYKKMEQDKTEYMYDIVFLGRLTYPKNPKRLINVIEKVVLKNSSVKVGIIGTGDMEDELKKMVKDKKIDENVEFLGYRDNPYKILYSAKLMIMTSLWEGTPMCALEAMALGVPIVSTPTDGLCKVVHNEKSGFLCETDDELVDACCTLVMDKTLQSKMSEYSVQISKKNMNVELYKEKILGEYKNALCDGKMG